MRIAFIGLLAGLLLAIAGPAAAQDAVENTSSVEASGHRVMQLNVVIPAPVADVWTALTTAEGWGRMGVRHAHVDFRTGGVIETSYGSESALVRGARTNIRNQIVAYVPGRMLAIRNVQAPPDFPNAEEFARTATVMELTPLDGGRTRLTLTATGFADGPAFDGLYALFLAGNSYSLGALRDSFAAD
jgi:uncharacterized protein YndB with AHSA1/START domain